MSIAAFKIIYDKLIYKPPDLNHFTISFTNNILHDVSCIKEKYSAIKKIIDTDWIGDTIRDQFINEVYITNKVYFGFLKFYNIISKKYVKYYDFNEDFCGNNLSTLKSNCKIELYEDKKYYIFRISDIISIINSSLSVNYCFHLNPKKIANPFTNNPFTLSSLYNIYNEIKMSNYKIPILFHYYYLSNFNLELMATNYNYEINEYIIEHFVRSLTPNRMVKIIRNMISILKPIFKGIIISKDFPENILISAFKPFLKYYYIIQNTSNYHKLYHIKEFLFRKMILFTEKNPSFGRVIYKSEKVTKFDLKKGFNTRKVRKKIICSEFTPFHKLNVNEITKKRIDKLWMNMNVDKLFNIQCNYMDVLHSDSDNDSDSDSDDSEPRFHFRYNEHDINGLPENADSPGTINSPESVTLIHNNIINNTNNENNDNDNIVNNTNNENNDNDSIVVNVTETIIYPEYDNLEIYGTNISTINEINSVISTIISHVEDESVNT